ncbi:MAG: hypothetical protein ACRC62_29585 [Microcoleus sp.]
MKVLFDPSKCPYIVGNKFADLSVAIPKPRKEGDAIQLEEKIIKYGENELTQEQFDVLDPLYPRAFEILDASSGTPEPVKSESGGGKKPTKAQRNQVIDQLKAGGLDQATLESILNDYTDDAEIMSLVEVAMSGL